MTIYFRSIDDLDIVRLCEKADFPWRTDCLKIALRALGRFVLVWGLGNCIVPAFAETPTFNPARLEAFCPKGSEVVNAQQSKLLTLRDQAQIKKNVQGFISLDAEARRSVGHPLGASVYWEKGYTTKFDDAKEVPVDWVRYIAYHFSNVCVTKEGALAVIVLDVADMAGQHIDPKRKAGGAFLSPQLYWDVFSKAEVHLPDKEFSPEQPVLFAVIPLYKDGAAHWVIEEKKVPMLKKINKANWRAELEKRGKAYKCADPAEKFRSTCAFNEKERLMLTKYSRPAWSVYPKK